MSKALAAKQAKRLLVQVGFKSDDYDPTTTTGCSIDLEAIADKLQIQLNPSKLPDSVSGVFFRRDKKLFLIYNEDQSEHRQRFTIAHEIGHYILHASESLHYDKDVVFYRSNDISNSDEVEANQFAAEILMPESLIERCITSGIKYVDELANKFNVSEDAMRYRLINLGYL